MQQENKIHLLGFDFATNRNNTTSHTNISSYLHNCSTQLVIYIPIDYVLKYNFHHILNLHTCMEQ
jgi:hypothetical protein